MFLNFYFYLPKVCSKKCMNGNIKKPRILTMIFMKFRVFSKHYVLQ